MTVVLLVLLGLLLVVAVGLSAAPRSSEDQVLRALRRLALAAAVVPAVALFDATWEDSGSFALWALGLPALLCLVVLLAAQSRLAAVVTWVAAVCLLFWALLLGLGVGLFFLPSAFVAVLVAVLQSRRRQARIQ